MQIRQNRPLDKFYEIFIYADKHFMHCNVWCDKKLCGTNLCDQCLTRIIHINKTCAEKMSLYGKIFKAPSFFIHVNGY